MGQAVTEPDEATDPPAGDEVEAPSGWPRLVVVTQAARAVVAVFVVVAAVVDWRWLGWPSVWIAVAALLAAHTPRNWDRRAGTVLAAALALGAAALAATTLQRTDADVPRLAARALDRDLAPWLVYGATLGLLAMAAAGILLVVAWSRSGAVDEPAEAAEARRWRRVGLAGGVGLVAVLFLAGSGLRVLADARAEAATVHHEVDEPVAPRPEAPRPTTLDEALRTAPAGADGSAAVSDDPVAVPGWDAMVARERSLTTNESSVVATSKRSAADERWRYQREGRIDGVTVDPDAGRVLLVANDAAIVLALDDGREVRRVELVDDIECRDPIGASVHDPELREAEVTVGAAAVMLCNPEKGFDPERDPLLVAMIDVASGAVLGTTPTRAHPDDDNRDDCSHAALTSTASPFVVQAGRDCPAVLLALDGGRLHQVAEIPPPAGTETDSCSDEPCVDRLLATDDVILVPLRWDLRRSDPDRAEHATLAELVALSPDGDILWRVTDESSIAPFELLDGSVVIRTGDAWRQLSLDDGHELARRPIADQSDGDR